MKARPWVVAGRALQGKKVRVFKVGGGAVRSLPDDAPYPVVAACIARFKDRGEVRYVDLGDYIPPLFSQAELRSIGRL